MTTTVLSTIPSTPSAPSPGATEAAADRGAEGSQAPSTEPASAVASVAPGKTEPVQEEKKSDEPDPDLVLAQKFESIAKREARARKAEAAVQERLTSLAEKEKKLEARLAEIDEFFADPAENLSKLGKDPVEVIKRFAKPQTEEEKRLARLEQREKEREEEAKKLREEAEKNEKQHANRQFWSQWVSEITEDEYPNLTGLYQPTQIPDLVLGLLNRPQDPSDDESPTVREFFKSRYGREPTRKEIRDALEAEAETRATSLIERFKPKTQAASEQVTPSTPAATSESPSLSNQHASSSPSSRSGAYDRAAEVKRLKEELEAETASTTE
jgi:hypothetical protein